MRRRKQKKWESRKCQFCGRQFHVAPAVSSFELNYYFCTSDCHKFTVLANLLNAEQEQLRLEKN